MPRLMRGQMPERKIDSRDASQLFDKRQLDFIKSDAVFIPMPDIEKLQQTFSGAD